MPYLLKKVGGLALVLLGLAVARGGLPGLGQEMLGGLILMVLGAGLMGLKILRRNPFQTGRSNERRELLTAPSRRCRLSGAMEH